MELTLSVIVCAHDEAGYLGACLHSLLAQSRPPDESLVINTDSSDATGDILVYVDADCRAPLQWLEKIERRFLKRPSLFALSAPYRFYDWQRAGARSSAPTTRQTETTSSPSQLSNTFRTWRTAISRRYVDC